jgi:hypothetical protein
MLMAAGLAPFIMCYQFLLRIVTCKINRSNIPLMLCCTVSNTVMFCHFTIQSVTSPNQICMLDVLSAGNVYVADVA